MAKNYSFIRLILLTCLCSCCIELHASLSHSVAAIYMSQVGVVERTGHNDGQEVEQYLASVGLTKGNPWCAAFVFWTLNQAGIKDLPRSGYSPSWFTRNVVFRRNASVNKMPIQADVFGIWFQDKGRIAHVGFIDAWPTGSYCITVEGNTNKAGSREGDGVMRKRRLKLQIYIVTRWT